MTREEYKLVTDAQRRATRALSSLNQPEIRWQPKVEAGMKQLRTLQILLDTLVAAGVTEDAQAS